MRGDAQWQRAEQERRRRFWRVLGGSALVHVAGFALMVFSPDPRSSLALPAVVTVDLVSLPAAALAVPDPAPSTPPPAPSKPAPKRPVVLPKTPQRAPEPKREAAKPKPKPQPRATPPPPDPEPESAEYEDVLAELRAMAGEKRPERSDPRASGGATSGPGVPVPPEVAAWIRSARVHVRQAWVLPPGFRDAPLETHLEVQIDPSGRLLGEPRITRRSGNPWFDEGVVRAMQKASPLPPPPRPGTWPFVFSPEDLL